MDRMEYVPFRGLLPFTNMLERYEVVSFIVLNMSLSCLCDLPCNDSLT